MKRWEALGDGIADATVLISHDRYFLDVTVTKMVEIWNKKVHFYVGNYEKYLTQKAERKALLENAYRNQKERIEQLEAFINRFRYQATKAAQVQSRIKLLEKVVPIEVPPERKKIRFDFPTCGKSGRSVLELTRVRKAYGDLVVFDQLDLHIGRIDEAHLHPLRGQVERLPDRLGAQQVAIHRNRHGD